MHKPWTWTRTTMWGRPGVGGAGWRGAEEEGVGTSVTVSATEINKCRIRNPKHLVALKWLSTLKYMGPFQKLWSILVLIRKSLFLLNRCLSSYVFLEVASLGRRGLSGTGQYGFGDNTWGMACGRRVWPSPACAPVTDWPIKGNLWREALGVKWQACTTTLILRAPQCCLPGKKEWHVLIIVNICEGPVFCVPTPLHPPHPLWSAASSCRPDSWVPGPPVSCGK